MYADTTDGISTRKIRLRSQDGTVMCGCRFKYMAEEIPADYNALVKALNDAIDATGQEKGANLVTNEKMNFEVKELNFDEIKNKFDSIVTQIIQNHSEQEMNEVWSPKITQITEKYLGKGKKASQCTRDQVEQLNLIVLDLEDLIK